MAALALAHRDALGIAAPHGNHGVRHQRVMQDDVGLHQKPLRPERQKVFRPRTGPHQSHMAGRCVGTGEHGGSHRMRARDIAPGNGARRRPLEELTPEATARRAFGKQLLRRIAKGDGQRSERAQRRRQHPVDARTNHLGKNRPGTLRADGDRDRGAIDQRRGEEIAKLGPVDRVDLDAESTGIRDNASIQWLVPARGEHQRGPIEILPRVSARDMNSRIGGDPAQQVG
ncbi:hypothetical protein CF98_40260 [Halopseudomonas bauzanensis]|nr:hypothetical protein CF98_40260 [Halopseudomonas bauzanensis]